MLSLINVSKSYMQGNQARSVLNDTSFNVESGEIIAIMGRSGSGKSTLLNVMSGLDMPDNGDVNISGILINQLDEDERTCYRRQHMGFVFQFFNLIPTLSVSENIHLPLELNNALNASSIAETDQLLRRVGLYDRKDHYPDQLSGGEQQRIAILRAIIHKPDLIFADEPTGNLDAETGKRILDLLKDIVDATKTTLILVTHSEDACRIAHRTYNMEDGKLILFSSTLADT